jgi:hypothetical protein
LIIGRCEIIYKALILPKSSCIDRLNTKQMASVENTEEVVAVPTLLRSGCCVSVELGSI